ncbi:MAG: hypothetical protein R3D25_13450 [Geminicoccaceae bacterium]
MKDQPAVYAQNSEKTEVVDEHTVDLYIKNPAEPIMINSRHRRSPSTRGR